MATAKTKKTKKTSDKKTTSKKKKEQFKLSGSEIVDKVKDLIKEGNVRRIIIKNEKGELMLEIPVTLALVGAVFAPTLAAVGALTALVSNVTIEVDRK